MTCVSEALRRTPKGRLKYDRYWSEDDIKEIVEDITRRGNSLNFSLASVVQNPNAPLNSSNNDIQNSSIIVEPSTNKPISPSESYLDISPQEMKAEFTLREYDSRRQHDVEEAILNRRFLSKNYSQLLVKQAKQQMELVRAQQEQAVEFQTKFLEQENEIREQEVQQRQQDLKERHKILAKLTTARMKEAEVTQKQMEEATQKRLIEQQQKFDILLACQREMNELFGKITEALRSCIHKHHLPDSAKQALGKLKEVSSTMDQCVASAKIKNVTNENVRIAQTLVHNVKEYLNAVQKGVEKANEMEEKSDIQTVSAAESSELKSPVLDESKPKDRVGAEQSSTKQLSSLQIENSNIATLSSTFLTECASSSALKEYSILQDHLCKFQRSYQELVSDAKLKQYRFDLQKAVNIPVNAISPQSGSHVRDKLERLTRLLNCQIVEVGNKRVSASDHSQARQFCKDLLAKKFVKQGEEQVSSKYEAAFSIATVIIGLWIEFPDFGDLLLAHFHKRCPYVVPFYIPKQNGQSQEDHYKALGYVYLDGTIEKQDKFLKRMSGMMRLYAAIIHSPVPKGINKPHPHSVECGWKWLTRILNLEPQPDITATMLFDFLEVAGSTLQQSYGRQFLKLLHLLCNSYFPKIRSITPDGAGGPLTRLENFLHKCLQQGKIPVPEGSLSSSFWYS